MNARSDRRALALLSLGALSALLLAGQACKDASTDVPVAHDEDAGGGDGGGVTGDAGPQDSGCPPPKKLSPSDLGKGFTAPQAVTLIRDIDGDTAHFKFPDGTDTDVRFLWVNTEESKTDATTAFGIKTGDVVKGYLEVAKDIIVVPQENPKKPGTPNLDPYGRTLGLVFADGDLFQTRLVREGWSAYYTLYGCAPEPVHSALVDAEAEANANHRGIWEPNHPTDYRRVFDDWIGANTCRPNPYESAYCP